MNKNWIKFAVIAIASCLCVKYSDTVFGLLALLFNTLKPLWMGFAIAYILNILMGKLEKIYFPRKKEPWVDRTRRPVCVFASIFIVLFIAVFLILLVIPAMGDSIYVLTKDIPKAFLRFQKWLSGQAENAGFLEIQELVNGLKIDWNDLYNKLSGVLSKGIGSIFTSAFSVANLIASFTITGVVAVIFSIYMLFQKENLKRQFKKAASVYLPQRWRSKAEEFLHLANETFTSFISGQVLEAFILGTLCGVGMFILRLPYALMTGVIVGVSALIPVMGAYIGAIAGAFMILTISPLKALIFLIFLAILQQVEGNVIYPRVVGGSIGLPGIWVLAAVTVGGGLLGVPGMLLGVPLTATLYKWIRKDVNERVQNHRMLWKKNEA
ncbi:MAG: AI-2E family transporter [Lachnospiraceae bacterium]|nr:AI-2E family transporter [Lachnospiraceae bacterium]